MINKILISLFTVTLLTACGSSTESSFSSSGGGTETAASTSGAATETASSSGSATEKTPENNTSETSDCAVGRYAWITPRDGKVHFELSLNSGGFIQYYINGNNTGEWAYSGDTISITGPLQGDRVTIITLNFTVTKVASDCKVLEFTGRSQAGTPLRVIRI